MPTDSHRRFFLLNRVRAGGLGAGLLIVAACSLGSESRIRQQTAAINNGTIDSDDIYRDSVVSVGNCTGTLISRRHVVTANHCITGSINTPTGTLFGSGQNSKLIVAFGADSNTSTRHMASSKIDVRQAGPIDMALGNAAFGVDVAVITLVGSPPASWNVHAAHPPTPGSVCVDTLPSATLLGYGRPVVSSFADGLRRISEGIWGVSCGSEVCFKDWGSASSYRGTLPGDSGGPLFGLTGNGSDPYVLCGVSSANGPVNAPTYSKWAITDGYGNDSFIQGIAWDTKNNSWYDNYPDNDWDKDGVPDSVDNCKYIRNSEQWDTDNDGTGDTCDACPRVHSWDKTNSNRDAEALVTPEGEDWEPSNLALERDGAWLANHFPADVCDTQPLTTAVPTGNAYTPAGGRAVACTRYPGIGCGGIPVSTTCPVARGNRIDEESHFYHPSATTPKLVGWSRPSVCRCTAGSPAACAGALFHCDTLNFATGLDSGWIPPHLDDADSGSSISTTATIGSQPQSGVATEYWNISSGAGGKAFSRQWGWRYWQDVPVSVTPQYGTVNVFEGLVWTWVRRADALSAGAFADAPTGTANEQKVRQYIDPYKLKIQEVGNETESGPDCVIGYKPKIWPIADTCPMCASSILAVKSGDPNPWQTAIFLQPGFAEKSASSKVTSAVVGAFLQSDRELFMASDGPGVWTGGKRAGVVVNTTNHQVAGRIGQNVDGTFILEAAGDDSTGLGNLVAATSGRHQEVAFFGETNANGQPLHQVRIYDLDTDKARVVPIVGPFFLTDPLAAAYRSDDDSYYVLDRTTFAGTSSPSIRLVRLNRGMATENVAEWERSDKMKWYSLTVGVNGSIVPSCWNESNFVVGELLPDPQELDAPVIHFTDESPNPGEPIAPHGIHLRGVYQGVGQLLTPGIRTPRGMQYWIDGSAVPVLGAFGNVANPPDLALADLGQCF